MSDPLHTSPAVAAAAASSRSEAEARLEKEQARQKAAFDAWLAQHPDVRRFIAESSSPALTRSMLFRASMGGFSNGYRAGALETALDFIHSGAV